MRKRNIFILILIVLGFIWALFYLPLFTHVEKKTFPLKSGRLMELLIMPVNYDRWMNKTLRQMHHNSVLKVSTKGTSMAVYTIREKSKSKRFLLSAQPAKTNEAKTDLHLSFKASLWQKMIDFNEEQTAMVNSFSKLENLVKSPLAFYGYDIHEAKVPDSTFLYHAITTTNKDRQKTMQKIFEVLIDYAEQKNAGFNGKRIFHFTREGDDSIRLYGSIGINHPETIPNNSPYPLKRMPFGKNLLVTPFEGPYMRVEQAYAAIEQFKLDHQYISMAIPYHRITAPELSLADSTITRLEVCYPVY
jgi:effector-binding domain-containing protein